MARWGFTAGDPRRRVLRAGFAVRDTGIGISPARIEIESKLGEGSEFRLLLPAPALPQHR